MLIDVGMDSDRWAALIEAAQHLPPRLRELVETRLSGLNAEEISGPLHHRIWDEMRSITARHRTYSDAAWAFPAEESSRLESLTAGSLRLTQSIATHGSSKATGLNSVKAISG